MYLSGISVRKIAGVTEVLSRVRTGKNAASRTASRLEEQQKEWRERSLEEAAGGGLAERCVVHFERNVLAHVPASETSELPRT